MFFSLIVLLSGYLVNLEEVGHLLTPLSICSTSLLKTHVFGVKGFCIGRDGEVVHSVFVSVCLKEYPCFSLSWYAISFIPVTEYVPKVRG